MSDNEWRAAVQSRLGDARDHLVRAVEILRDAQQMTYDGTQENGPVESIKDKADQVQLAAAAVVNEIGMWAPR